MGIKEKIQLERFTALWRKYGRLSPVAHEMGTSTLKVRKLLITAGIYTNAQHERIRKLVMHGMGARELAIVTRLGPKVVDSYLPYQSGPFSCACWKLGQPRKLQRIPIFSSMDHTDIQPWLQARCEALIQSFLSLDLYLDTTYVHLIHPIFPLASQYALALQSLAFNVFGLAPEGPVCLDYGNLTLVDLLVAYHFGRWLKEPWDGAPPTPKLERLSSCASLVRLGTDIRYFLFHDVSALAEASVKLSQLFKQLPDRTIESLLKIADANIQALFSYLASPLYRMHELS